MGAVVEVDNMKKDKFLLIYEDQSLQIVNSVDEFDFSMAEEGIITIVDLQKEMYYWVDRWKDIPFNKREDENDLN